MPDTLLATYIRQFMRNRFIATPVGEAGLNYLCEGYKAFFTHVDGPMQRVAHLLNQCRYVDEIMRQV
jgi:serine-type anaerobic sulfatase-maturating enzyme